jgi:hypothetical protein
MSKSDHKLVIEEKCIFLVWGHVQGRDPALPDYGFKIPDLVIDVGIQT